jgi:hypothetical protein
MTTSIKNFIGSLAFMAILFTVACTKDAVDTVTSDANISAVNELVTLTEPPSGPNGPTTPDSMHHNGDTSHHCWGRGHGEHPGRVKGDSIGFSGLPSAVQTYLLTNSDTSKIVKIVKITLPDGSFQYVVRLKDHTHLHFDAAGVYISTTTDNHHFVTILLADLPAAAQTYVNAHTTAANIAGIIKITKPDGTVIYGVRLTDNTRFTFDAAGVLIANPKDGRHGHH